MMAAGKGAIAMAVVLLLTAGFEGCAGSAGGTDPIRSAQPTVVPVSASPTPPSVVSETPTPDPASQLTPPSMPCPDRLPDGSKVGKVAVKAGKVFGFVRYFDGKCLYVDPAEMFGNEAAVKAAREDGEIGPNEDLPNPFYIRNRDREVFAVPVSGTFKVTLLFSSDSGMVTRHFTGTTFAALYGPGRDPYWDGYSPLNNIPTDLRVSEGRAARVDEVYIP